MQQTATVLILLLLSSPALTVSYLGPGQAGDDYLSQATLLADAGTERDRQDSVLDMPDIKDGSQKKCMTICKEWGEKCIINPRTGRRDCRRICKEFGEECF